MSQKQIVICKLNHFEFCKFKQHCNKNHDNEVCEKQSECKDRTCFKRHQQIYKKFTKMENADIVITAHICT